MHHLDKGTRVRAWMRKDRYPDNYEEGVVIGYGHDLRYTVAIDRLVVGGVEQDITGRGFCYPFAEQLEVV